MAGVLVQPEMDKRGVWDKVAGVAALMLQKYRDRILRVRRPGASIHDHPFWNSTARAILVHTATDLVDTSHRTSTWHNPDFAAAPGGANWHDVYLPGPDWATGYGLVNAKKACEYVDTTRFREDTIADRQIRYYSLTVPQGTQRLRVTLVWDDPPPDGVQGSANCYERKLVNDLDLYLVPPSADTVRRPLVLDYTPIKGRNPPLADGVDSMYYAGASPPGWYRGISVDTVLAHPARPGIQRLDNIEMVDIPSPAAGAWTVVVEGADVCQSQSIAGNPGNPKQDFSLVYDINALPAATPTDSLGPVFVYKGADKSKGTARGHLQLCGHRMSGTLAGLRFGSAASMDTLGNLVSGTVYTNQGAWLDTPGNLTGGLVLRGPDGKVTLHVATNGVVRVRGNVFEGFGRM